MDLCLSLQIEALRYLGTARLLILYLMIFYCMLIVTGFDSIYVIKTNNN